MTPKDAPYKLAQRVTAPIRSLATCAELRAYQRKHGTSALRIARLAKAKIDASQIT